ncbi:MAG TPA: ABC transporter permease [Candidatus Limnocylindria bacterium]|jgi:ABC-2 type transport system permease protein|nr:ABC transporter permease [Candidatus Limnocylindria bacterium]
MRAAGVILAKDLRARLRDRTFFIVAIIAPFGLAAIFATLLPSGSDDLDLRLGYADLDGSSTSAAFRDGPLQALVDAELATITAYDDAQAARAAVEAGDVSAVAIVPSGFGQDVELGQATAIEVVGDVDAGFSTDILRSLAEGYARELESVRLAVATVIGDTFPVPRERVAELVAGALEQPSPVSVVDVPAELRQMGAHTFYAASMAIFFLFFTAQFGVLSLLAERRGGTLPRLVAAPIPPAAIVAGKALGSFVMGISAMVVLAVASTLLLGADWGDPLGVAALIVAAVVAATGITAFITTFARTEEQAGGWNSIVAVTLAILGGAFMDLSQAPEILSRLSFLTPHAWFLQGLDEMSAPSFTYADLALPLAALLGIGIVTGAIGLWRARGLVVAR